MATMNRRVALRFRPRKGGSGGGALEGGLIAPAIHDVDRKSLDEVMHDFLVAGEGDSISLNPDTVLKTTEEIVRMEQQQAGQGGQQREAAA